MKPKSINPPDFELASWEGAAPGLVLPKGGDDALAQLVLALAVVFNDLKGVLYASRRLGQSKPVAAEVTATMAQHRGMSGQVVRWLSGLRQELMKLLGAHRAVVRSRGFGLLVESVPKSARAAWDALEGVAMAAGREKEDKKSTAWILQRLRNQVAFHYAAPAFAKGYRHHFFAKEMSDVNRQAVFSDGDSMEGTRFYFADAAAQAALETEISEAKLSPDELVERLGQIATSVNFALKHIVVAYLRGVDPATRPFSAVAPPRRGHPRKMSRVGR